MKVNLPKNALQRIQMGQSFAEYDVVRNDPNIFVATPASLVATQPDNPKCFFVGRRGTGKTAIAYHLLSRNKRAVAMNPQVFDLIRLPVTLEEFKDIRQRPFRSLVCVFERALLCELVKHWVAQKIWAFPDEATGFTKDRGLIENSDFDNRVLSLTSEVFDAYRSPNDKLWLRQIKRAQEMTEEANQARVDSGYDFVFLIDRLDEAWDGSDGAVISLMALMHACVHLRAACMAIRPYLFLRENIYTRIRQIDNEFSRLETSAVFLEWTREKLVELAERRLVRPFSTKPALGGEAWGHFFEDTPTFQSQEEIFGFCENRPRDVLTYITYGLEAAVGRGASKIGPEDIRSARDRFSTSKLKDLADEFAENYPSIHIVLQLFYGLATDYTLPAIENFIQKLIVDRRVAEHCAKWFFDYTVPHRFVELLFNIGFLGVKDGKGYVFKASVGDAAFLPAIHANSIFRIQPAYHSALHLRELVLPEISDETILRHSGILEDLPTGVSFEAYQQQLKALQTRLETLAPGREHASDYEDVVGDVIKLCFYRALTNVKPKERSHNGVVIRDWIAANRAVGGFWAIIRDKYKATQIVWECKNYDTLAADDFQQGSYYLNDIVGRFLILAHRGKELESSYYRHLERIARQTGGMVLVLTERDMKVFIRQALHGKLRDDHINEIYDCICRAIS